MLCSTKLEMEVFSPGLVQKGEVTKHRESHLWKVCESSVSVAECLRQTSEEVEACFSPQFWRPKVSGLAR